MLYRNWKYEQVLDSLLWKVQFKDIEIKEEKKEAVGVNEALAKCNPKVTVCLNVACIIKEIFILDIGYVLNIYSFLFFFE